jgi:hypothetical protein
MKFFLLTQTGWGAGVYPGPGMVIKTTDSGNNWINQFSVTEAINDVYFTTPQNGWISCSNGKIFYTSNGGTNWILQSTGVYTFLNSVFFLSDSVGWCVGTQGTILKTTTEGLVLGMESSSTNVPKNYKLHQNYPNPFNPSTEIKFSLPNDEIVTIKIYNLLGGKITTLVNRIYRKAGSYSVKFDGTNLASGLYIYRIEARQAGSLIVSYTQSKKMLLIK